MSAHQHGDSSARARVLGPWPPQPVTVPKTDFEGLGLVKSFVINEFEPIDGSIPFEVVVDGESIWLGMGNDRVDGRLKAIMKITEQESEVPDN